MSPEPNEPYYYYWGKAGKADDGVYHLLPYHCLDVAAVGWQLLQKDPVLLNRFVTLGPHSDEDIPNLIAFFLAVHDLGKFSDRFQNLKPDIFTTLQKPRERRAYEVRHDTMGLQLLESDIWDQLLKKDVFNLDPQGEPFDWSIVWGFWLQAVGGHHGKPVSEQYGRRVSTLFTPKDRAAAGLFVDACISLFLPDRLARTLPYNDLLNQPFARSSWLLAGLTVLCDWIGSNDYFFPYVRKPMALEDYWHRHALPQASEALTGSGLLPVNPSGKPGMKALFPEIETPTSMQEHASTWAAVDKPQLFILEDLTGSGKTEAALVLAHQILNAGAAESIFMALPTMATADAMYRRFGRVYRRLFAADKRPWLVLAHSSRNLSDQFRDSVIAPDHVVTGSYGSGESTAEATCTSWLADNRKKSLLATVGVGTIDQALMAVLPLRHQALRLLGLSRSVLIVDEVHAYDAYMNETLQRLLEFQASWGGSAILLSATLPRQLRQALVRSYCLGAGISPPTLSSSSYPLMTTVAADACIEIPLEASRRGTRSIDVVYTGDRNRVLAYIQEATQRGDCVCWIRNTVGDAIEAYETLSGLHGPEKVTLFHARFALGDRLDIEERVLKWFGKQSDRESRRGRILVATQVVEQSLDVDFDGMITDLAPMDLIIQRAGRLHRHPERGERGTPQLLVFGPIPTEEPDRDWVRRFFPAGAMVYQRHGALWLTARILSAHNVLRMPEDARDYIEQVFGERAITQIPPALLERELEALGRDQGARALAHGTLLSPDEGYSLNYGHWEEESRTPTRLGEPTTQVLLLRDEDGVVRTWYDDMKPGLSERLSQLSVAIRLIASPTREDDIYGIVPIQLHRLSNDRWIGTAENENGQQVDVFYSTVIGLQVEQRT